MGFATLEDLEGSFELVIFPDTWAASRDVLKRAQEGGGDGGAIPLVAEGTLESADPAKILVRRLFPLTEASEHLAVRVHIQVLAAEATSDRLTALRSLLAEHAGDCGVVLHLRIPGESEDGDDASRTPKAWTRHRRCCERWTGCLGAPCPISASDGIGGDRPRGALSGALRPAGHAAD